MARRPNLCFAVYLSSLAVLPSCRQEPAAVKAENESTNNAVGALIDLGSDEGRAQVVEGFSAPEQVEARRASWSEGEISTLSFSLRGKASRYLLAFLAEPYFRVQPVSLKLTLNKSALAELELKPGWNAYALPVEASAVQDGNNDLTLRYSKTARPADSDPGSSDTREISVRFDQIQILPLNERLRLVFDAKNAFSRAALGEGWGIDASDRAPGIWTVGTRAQIRLNLAQPSATAYTLELTAHGLTGVTSQAVRVALNGMQLGELKFAAKRSAQRLAIPAGALREQNELLLQFQSLKPPSEIDPKSKDTRLLGLRLLKLEVSPAS